MAEDKKTKRAKMPAISDAELVVMKIVWRKSPATANEIVAALESRTDWKPKTVHTLITRLVQKGALTFIKRGREHLFSPLINARDFGHEASRSFLRRVFDGEIAPFLACFLERERLSPDELRELRRILDSKTP